MGIKQDILTATLPRRKFRKGGPQQLLSSLTENQSEGENAPQSWQRTQRENKDVLKNSFIIRCVFSVSSEASRARAIPGAGMFEPGLFQAVVLFHDRGARARTDTLGSCFDKGCKCDKIPDSARCLDPAYGADDSFNKPDISYGSAAGSETR